MRAASRITAALAGGGIATLRFDFTGLGGSDGDFANTGFSSKVADLVAAADFMRQAFEPPVLLIGHSLGGTAVLAAAERVPEARAVATIAAPLDADHVLHNFTADVPRIEAEGAATVRLAGRSFTISRSFVEDVRRRSTSRNPSSRREREGARQALRHQPHHGPEMAQADHRRRRADGP